MNFIEPFCYNARRNSRNWSMSAYEWHLEISVFVFSSYVSSWLRELQRHRPVVGSSLCLTTGVDREQMSFLILLELWNKKPAIFSFVDTVRNVNLQSFYSHATICCRNINCTFATCYEDDLGGSSYVTGGVVVVVFPSPFHRTSNQTVTS
jgi:hypothetical protein